MVLDMLGLCIVVFGIKQEVEVFVSKDDNAKIQLVKLKNETPRRRKLKLVYYMKPVIGEDEIKTNEFLDIKYNKNANMILVNNMASSDYKNMVFVSCSEKIKSYTKVSIW